MDPNRFDAITQQLGAARSRRGVLKTLGAAALGAVGLAGASRADAAPGGNSACAHFCQTAFPPGPQRGQCVSDAAHGTGACYSCAGPLGQQCSACNACSGGACVPANNGQTCTPSGGGSGTCQGGSCVPCTADGDSCTGAGECCSGNCFNSICAEFVTKCGTSSCGPGTRGCAGDTCCGPPAISSCDGGQCCDPGTLFCCGGTCCSAPATHCNGFTCAQ